MEKVRRHVLSLVDEDLLDPVCNLEQDLLMSEWSGGIDPDDYINGYRWRGYAETQGE